MAKKASATPSPAMIAAAAGLPPTLPPTVEPPVGDGVSFAEADKAGLIPPINTVETQDGPPTDTPPKSTMIAEGDPEGRQPGDPNSPIELPDYLKEQSQPTFKAFVGDVPMGISDMEAEVAKSGVTIVENDGSKKTVFAQQIDTPPVAVEPPTPPMAPAASSVQARINEEIEAGRRALAAKNAERERVAQQHRDMAARDLASGEVKPGDLTYQGNR